MKVFLFCAFFFLFVVVSGFWDDATTTADPYVNMDIRQSFFRWQETQPAWKALFFPSMDFVWLNYNRRLNVVCGLSYKFTCIGTGTILNRRTVLTACNLIDEYSHIQSDLRIWALGSRGVYYTPYRYRVWRFTRVVPKSLNPEHLHGYRGTYSPRHDVCVIHSFDQMMTVNYVSRRGHIPHRSFVIGATDLISDDMWHTGSGYEDLKHIRENYKIFITKVYRSDFVNCRKYLPKWWGKFICIRNSRSFPGIQNGAGLHTVGNYDNWDYLLGLACFEIRYNEDRIFVFTDLRYYEKLIKHYAYIWPGQYYEYAYPQWGAKYGAFPSYYANSPRIPLWQIKDDFYPLG